MWKLIHLSLFDLNDSVSDWDDDFIVGNRSGEYACAAYVTFRDAYALETAVLLSVSCWLLLSENASWVENLLFEPTLT